MSSCDVVIPTHGRPRLLSALLESLAREARSSVHCVIIVDDTALPAGPEFRSPWPLRWVHLNERVFISEAKNIGLAHVDQPYVLFVDDDNIVTESTFPHPLSVLHERPEVAAVMPAVLYRRRPELVWVYATPWKAGHWEFQLIGRNRPRDPQREDRLLPTDALPNAGFYSAAWLRKVGGWSHRLRVNSSADLCRRLKTGGAEVWADSSSFILHDVEAPGERAFWAGHQVSDLVRTEEEIVDWFGWQREEHPRMVGFRLRAAYHSLGFLLPLALGTLVRSDSSFRRAAPFMARGFLRGWKGAGSRTGARSDGQAPAP